MGEREHLEQPPHLAIPRSGEAARCGGDGGRGLGRGIAHQPVGTGGKAEAGEEIALLQRPERLQAGLPPQQGKAGEIHMGGEIGLAGIGKGIGEAVGLERLQRVAMAAGMAGMGFAMLGNMATDTNESRSSRVNFGTYPGMQNFQKTSNSADVTVVVGNRILVTVKVSNAGSEAPALQLTQAINFAHLAALIGG